MAKRQTRPPADYSHADLVKARQVYPRLGVPVEDLGFRRLSGEADRDLPAVTHDRMVEIAYYLGQANPLARWLLETTKNFVVGEGITLRADDPDQDEELQDLLDTFWYDPINNFSMWQEEAVRELGQFGEQIWPAFVNARDGRLRLSCIDPALVCEILVDPDNARVPIGVRTKKSLKSQKERVFRVIYDEDDAGLFTGRTQTLRKGMTDGDCFVFTVNKASTATRGVSDLLHLFDWLDGYDQFLFDVLERSALLSSFVWDVTLNGADEPRIKKFLADTPPPRKGQLRAHNESVKWDAVSPDLKMEENDVGARLLRNQVLGGAGFPEHWYGGGGDVNRATAAEMGAPTFKMLSARQRRVRYTYEQTTDYQITQALLRGRLRGVADPYAYSVVMPEMVSKDLTALGTVLSSLSGALVTAKNDGLIDEATAQRIYSVPVAALGVEINLGDLADKIAEEAERRAAADYYRNPEGANGGGGEGGKKMEPGNRGNGEPGNQQSRRGTRVIARTVRLRQAVARGWEPRGPAKERMNQQAARRLAHG